MRRKLTRHPNINLHNDLQELLKGFKNANMEKSYHDFFSSLKSIIDFDHGTLYLWDLEKLNCQVLASMGRVMELDDHLAEKYNFGLTITELWEKKILLVNSDSADQDLKYLNQNQQLSPIKSFLSLYIYLGKRKFGLINLGHNKCKAFSREEVYYLELVCPILALTISNLVFLQGLSQKINTLIVHQPEDYGVSQSLLETEKKNAIAAVIASINHEINNPLMIISAYVQLMQVRTTDEETINKLEIINSQIVRISEVLTKLRKLENPVIEKYIADGNIDQILKLD